MNIFFLFNVEGVLEAATPSAEQKEGDAAKKSLEPKEG